MKASECKCYVCGKQAVAFYPAIDPDIPSTPYCPDCLYKAMVDLAKAVWKDDKGMQAVAIHQARRTVEKYRKKAEPGKPDKQ